MQTKTFIFQRFISLLKKNVRNDKNKYKNLCAEKLLISLADLTVSILIYVLRW